MNQVSLMTYIKDLGWVLLIMLLLPLWIALAWASLIIIVARHLYWWANRNTTGASSPVLRPRSSWADRWSSWSGGKRQPSPGDGVANPSPPAAVLIDSAEAAAAANR